VSNHSVLHFTAHCEMYGCKQSSETLMSGRCKNQSGTTVSVELQYRILPEHFQYFPRQVQLPNIRLYYVQLQAIALL